MSHSLEASFSIPDNMAQAPAMRVYMPLYFESAEQRAHHRRMGNVRFFGVMAMDGTNSSLYYRVAEGSPYGKAMERLEQVSAAGPEELGNLHYEAACALMDGSFDKSFVSFLPQPTAS